MKHRLSLSFVSIALVSLLALTALAVETVPVVNPLGNVSTVPQLVNQAVKTILGVVGALALFMFVYGGILWMTSAGNTNRIERGKDTLIWATIGLFVIFTSYAILNFILSALGGS